MAKSTVFESDYRPSQGIHPFKTADGTPVTALSFPSWEEFHEALGGLPPTSGYIVSPELITSPQMPDQELNRSQIEARVDAVRDLSASQPEATILLGTPSYDGTKPRNSLAVINNGHILGYLDKQHYLPTERRFFERTIQRIQLTLPRLGDAALICSDIQMPLIYGNGNTASSKLPDRLRLKAINDTTKTVLVSSYWAVPLIPLSANGNYNRFKSHLESSAQKMFEAYPQVEEIIVADRPNTDVNGKKAYTAHFKRSEPTSEKSDNT